MEPLVLIFDWRELGGPPPAEQRRRGFGTELLERTMAFEFKGRTNLEFKQSGFHCTIVIPLSRLVVHTLLLVT